MIAFVAIFTIIPIAAFLIEDTAKLFRKVALMFTTFIVSIVTLSTTFVTNDFCVGVAEWPVQLTDHLPGLVAVLRFRILSEPIRIRVAS